MKKTAIIYWSGTGNTEAMAEALAAAAQGDLFPVDAFDVDTWDDYDAYALGCSAMGAEELEDADFQPFFDAVKDRLADRPLALFGSYGWGDGEWMQTWEAECRDLGALLVDDPVICMEAPDDEALEALEALGKKLSS